MINSNGNENYNGKIDIINRTRRRKWANIKNIACLGKIMSISSIYEKGRQHWGWIEKMRCL